MNVLLIGSGGREHALAWKLLQSPRLKTLYMTSPHGAVEALQKEARIAVERVLLCEDEHAKIVQFAKAMQLDLVVIGNEAPLAAGLSDCLREGGIAVFGPSKQAAQLESSKAFSKAFMQRHQIPTARYADFTCYDEAVAYIDTIDYPCVIKASGLAAGKGVFLPDSCDEAKAIVAQLLVHKSLGEAGERLVIEERLQGQELSLLCFSDGHSIKLMPPARDHKRLLSGDEGPNTGGMGVYAPFALPASVSQDMLAQSILQRAVDGMRTEAMPFVGVLYAGLMLTANGPKVLEFNCRFGDPETQALMPLLQSDLLDVLEACVSGNLQTCTPQWRDEHAVCVVLAAQGYPESVKTGDLIEGLPQSQHDSTLIFHASSRMRGESFVTAGGRVLSVVALGETAELARKRAYEATQTIHFEGMQYRDDIAEMKHDLYARSGVDIAAGGETVKLMSRAVKSTYGAEVLAGIGAFGGMFDAGRIKAMRQPVLVASTDGVGTKVELAVRAGCVESVGHDIVHHSINDILVQGAKPLFFLDYIASNKLHPHQIAGIVTAMAESCKAAGIALLGGETAEMPGVYAPKMLDIAGTIIGCVEREDALPRSDLSEGDVILGLASSGPHTNGYSLIRRIVENDQLDVHVPELGTTLAKALLAPHRSYLPVLQAALEHPQKAIKALVHITGGGFWENIPRVLPKGVGAVIQRGSWPVPSLFSFLQKRADVSEQEMYRVFNMGIGMMLIVSPGQVAHLKSLIDEPCFEIGFLKTGEKKVCFV